MGDTFYKVTFVGSSDEYFFHYHEDAAAFLLESYFDESNIIDESEIMEANNEVADNDAIESYGQIDECWFEK